MTAAADDVNLGGVVGHTSFDHRRQKNPFNMSRLSSSSLADLHSVKELRESMNESRMTTVMAPMQSELNIECDLPIVLNYQTKDSKAGNNAAD